LNKLDLIIRDRQAELLALQADLSDALTGIDSPQIMGIFNMALHGYLNQGSNSERVQNAATWSKHTSTNDEPYKYSTSSGERIPKFVHNTNE